MKKDNLDDDLDNGPSLAEVMQQKQTSDLMQKLMEALSKPQAVPQITMPTLEVPAPIVHVQAAQPSQQVLAWTFTFERNNDGTIRSIYAEAT